MSRPLSGMMTYTQVGAGDVEPCCCVPTTARCWPSGKKDTDYVDLPPLYHLGCYTRDRRPATLGSHCAFGRGGGVSGMALPHRHSDLPAETVMSRIMRAGRHRCGRHRAPTGLSAVPDQATGSRSTGVTVAVLANDTDPDGNPLTPSAVFRHNGTTVVNADGTITYTPDADYYRGRQLRLHLVQRCHVHGCRRHRQTHPQSTIRPEPRTPTTTASRRGRSSTSTWPTRSATRRTTGLPFNSLGQLEIASQPGAGSTSFSPADVSDLHRPRRIWTAPPPRQPSPITATTGCYTQRRDGD